MLVRATEPSSPSQQPATCFSRSAVCAKRTRTYGYVNVHTFSLMSGNFSSRATLRGRRPLKIDDMKKSTPFHAHDKLKIDSFVIDSTRRIFTTSDAAVGARAQAGLEAPRTGAGAHAARGAAAPCCAALARPRAVGPAVSVDSVIKGSRDQVTCSTGYPSQDGVRHCVTDPAGHSLSLTASV
jgi:hypothetical protein